MNNISSFNEQQEKVTDDNLLKGLLPNGKYSHLRIILNRNFKPDLPQKYLMVNTSGFGVVRLNDVDYHDNKILLNLQDCTNGMVKQLTIDINDKKINFLLIAWDDVRRMVLAENKTTFDRLGHELNF